MPHTATLHVPALDCPDELALIERGLRSVPGIARCAPDYLSRNLLVEFDPAHTDAASIVRIVEAAGFPAQIALPISDAPSSTAGKCGFNVAVAHDDRKWHATDRRCSRPASHWRNNLAPSQRSPLQQPLLLAFL